MSQDQTTQKTLAQKVADASAAPPFVPPKDDKELATVRASYPRATSVERDVRGTIVIRH